MNAGNFWSTLNMYYIHFDVILVKCKGGPQASNFCKMSLMHVVSPYHLTEI